ncbi:MAG: hypothetical protein ACYS9X_18475, partial [Planctomycetota bacterium]
MARSRLLPSGGLGLAVTLLLVSLGSAKICHAGEQPVGADASAGSAERDKRANDAVARLSDSELVHEYSQPGTRLNEADHARPNVNLMFGFDGPEGPRYLMFRAIRREIVRRGGRTIPKLLALLRDEVTTTRQAPGSRGSGLGNYYISDLVNLLVDIRDPRTLDTLLDILEGLDGKATKKARYAAKRGLERLTYCSYYRTSHDSWNSSNTVQRLGAEAGESSYQWDFTAVSAFYREWLAEEGKDPARWLDLARQRARRIMETDDLAAVYCAARFLTYPAYLCHRDVSRDDDPQRTMARLAEIIGKSRRGEARGGGKPKHASRLHEGQRSSPSTRELAYLIWTRGPLARSHAAVLIRVVREAGLHDGGFGYLGGVGGKEIVAFFFECLPRFGPELAAAGVEQALIDRDNLLGVRLGRRHDGIPEELLHARGSCRWGTDRWAGRVFTSDRERLEWWQANRDKTPERWLRDGMFPTAAAADAGNERARAIIRRIIPDLPLGEGEPLIFRYDETAPPPAPKPRVKGPFRVEWLNEHGRALRYDPDTGALRLAAAEEHPDDVKA